MDAQSMANVPGPVAGASRPPRFTARLIVGLVIISVGVLFLLDAFGVPGVEDVWHEIGRYWPLVLVLIGIGKVANAFSASERVAGVVWMIAGGLMLAHSLDLITFSVWKVFWPALIILFGAGMVTRAAGGPRARTTSTEHAARTSAFAVMSGVTRKLSTPDFRGGEATAIMGGCEIDLRQCDITTGPAVFDIFVLMGGIDLYVPGDWTVRNDGIVLLGGLEDSRKETAGNPSKVLIVRGQAVMGGIEIKN